MCHDVYHDYAYCYSFTLRDITSVSDNTNRIFVTDFYHYLYHDYAYYPTATGRRGARSRKRGYVIWLSWIMCARMQWIHSSLSLSLSLSLCWDHLLRSSWISHPAIDTQLSLSLSLPLSISWIICARMQLIRMLRLRKPLLDNISPTGLGPERE